MTTSKRGADNSDQSARLKRIEGQVRGIQKMIEDGRYCVDIVTQIKAIRAALGKVELQVLENHMHHCVQKAIKSGSNKEREQAIDEILGLVKKTF